MNSYVGPVHRENNILKKKYFGAGGGKGSSSIVDKFGASKFGIENVY